MDAEIERAREREPDWDDVREQRVLTRVLEHKRPRGRRAVALAAIVFAGAAITLAIVWPPSGAPTAEHTAAPIAETIDEKPRLVLSDGSEVRLERDARVRVESDGAGRIELLHHAGSAEYVVAHRPEREFVVKVEAVEVRVRGTRFWVRARDGAVDVEVTEGRVEVTAPDRTAILHGGESVHMRTDLVARAERAAVPPEARDVTPGAPPEPMAEAPIVERDPRDRARTIPERAMVPEPVVRTFDEWLAEADRARGAGRVEEAARLFRAALDAYPNEPRRPSALFGLGQMERARGSAAEAARAFEACHRAGPRTALAEDALAQAALAWAMAGDSSRAATAAERYLRDYPAGLHAERMRNLAGDAP
jgi:transmembrane sensor